MRLVVDYRKVDKKTQNYSNCIWNMDSILREQVRNHTAQTQRFMAA